MRERVTFLHHADHVFDPKQLQLQNDSLRIKSLKAARQDRLTLGLDELPQEVSNSKAQQASTLIDRVDALYSYGEPSSHAMNYTFDGSHQNPTSTLRPSRPQLLPDSMSSILHGEINRRISDLLCPLLSKIFGARANCRKPEDAFIHLPVISERFASSTAFQFYLSLPSLTDFATYLHQKICSDKDESCRLRARSLKFADYLDVDYDTISQSLVLSAFWHSPPLAEVWDERIDNSQASIKVEVGVLANEKPNEPEELSLAGFLAVIGEDSKPNPTFFSFPSRHHVAPLTPGTGYSTAFLEPIGLHPTLRLTLPSSIVPPTDGCVLHTYLTLPSSLFLDKYQTSSPNLLASRNLHSIRSLAGETDLEAPIWAVSRWGSAVLLQLAPPRSTSSTRSTGAVIGPKSLWHADIPLHLRYLPPGQEALASVSVAWPIVFWACPSDEGTKMNTNPFDRVDLGYDGLFGPRTMFYHLQPNNSGEYLMQDIRVPVLDLQNSKIKWVESGTVVTVVLGFLWICLGLAMVISGSLGRQEVRQKKRD